MSELAVREPEPAGDVPALVRQGAEVKRTVLARAVRRHCQDRVLRHGDTTVVF